jgi:hypothetical protein
MPSDQQSSIFDGKLVKSRNILLDYNIQLYF